MTAIEKVIKAVWRILETTEVRQGLGAPGQREVAALLQEAELLAQSEMRRE